jgi:hypothetical protein
MENKQTEKICSGCGRSSLNPVSEEYLACCPDNKYIEMSNNKQSSVRWIVEELEKFELGKSEFYSKTAIINHADRMHKEEIVQAYNDGCYYGKDCWQEDYYNETFGGNNGETMDN